MELMTCTECREWFSIIYSVKSTNDVRLCDWHNDFTGRIKESPRLIREVKQAYEV